MDSSQARPSRLPYKECCRSAHSPRGSDEEVDVWEREGMRNRYLSKLQSKFPREYIPEFSANTSCSSLCEEKLREEREEPNLKSHEVSEGK